MATNPFNRKPEASRPKIWATGGQRPPFDIRALGRASLCYAREGVAPLHGWIARTVRRVALNVRDGAGRIPEAKLGRVAPFVPSHQRVAMWIKNYAAIHAHASASADPDVKRGNALVEAIEQHLWPLPDVADARASEPETVTAAAAEPEPEPVVLTEPEPEPVPSDPLASIRADIGGPTGAGQGRKAGAKPAARSATSTGTPTPPGQVAATAIQIE